MRLEFAACRKMRPLLRLIEPRSDRVRLGRFACRLGCFRAVCPFMKPRLHPWAWACAVAINLAVPSFGAPRPSTPDAVESPVTAAGNADLAKGREHWAFQPIHSPRPPKVRTSRTQTSIDAFIFARLQEK